MHKTAKSAKSAKFFMQRKTAKKFFLPHLADFVATANFFFWLSISVLSNWYNSPAKLKAQNFLDMTSENHLLFHILLSLSHFSHLLSQFFFLMSLSDVSVSRLLSPVSHLLSPVSHLSPISHLLSLVSHLLSPVSHWNTIFLAFSVYPFSWATFELAISAFHSLNFQLAVPNYGKKIFLSFKIIFSGMENIFLKHHKNTVPVVYRLRNLNQKC